MEFVGLVASAVTLGALFKSCIEAFDTIQLYKNQDRDFKKLLLRLNVEKCRLYIWGRSMGLTSGSPGSVLDDFPFPDVVTECLQQIINVFNDSDRIRAKYGCKALLPESTDEISPRHNYIIRTLATAFGNFRIRNSQAQEKIQSKSDVLQKSLWIIHDRKKFCDLVQEVQNLINGLQDITKDLASTNKQEEDIKSRIMSIRDLSTLDMVADVCEEPYPQIAYAASTSANSMSVAATQRVDIAAWRSEIESEESDGISAEQLEDLTVTELKHLVLRSRSPAELKKAHHNDQILLHYYQVLIMGLSEMLDDRLNATSAKA